MTFRNEGKLKHYAEEKIKRLKNLTSSAIYNSNLLRSQPRSRMSLRLQLWLQLHTEKNAQAYPPPPPQWRREEPLLVRL